MRTRLASIRLLFAAALALQWPQAARAEIEQVQSPCKQGVCTHRWPKVRVPAGWAHNRNFSQAYHFNAMAPEDESFRDAATVMYANAVNRAQQPAAPTLDDYIRRDHQSLRDETPDLQIQPDAALPTADGKRARSWRTQPLTAGQWERMAYLEEADHYIVFVISSRNEVELKQHMAAFEALVASYRE